MNGRYRDERLELNEGAQFQLLLATSEEERAGADAASGAAEHGLVFDAGAPLTIKIDLLMSELEKPGEGDSAASANGAKRAPRNVSLERPSTAPTFTRIATQTLTVQRDAATQQLHACVRARRAHAVSGRPGDERDGPGRH